MYKTVLESNTHYQFFENKNAPTLVLLHGWLQDWQCFSPIISELSKKFQLVIPDLPAFGKSTLGPNGDGSILSWNSQQYASWVAAFIMSLNLQKSQPLFILGHSFGGKIAAITVAEYASSLAPKISGLVLVDSSGIPVTLTVSKKIKQRIIQAVPNVLKNGLGKNLKQKLLTKLSLSTDHLQSSPQQQKILEKIISENILEYMPKISVPTALIWGRLDEATPVEHATAFHIALQNSELSIFEKSAHFPFLTQPTLFISTISEFITTTSKQVK